MTDAGILPGSARVFEGMRDLAVPPAGLAKRFAIFALDAAGRPELYAETDLGSEARRFERLGYRIQPSNDRMLHPTPPRKERPCTPWSA